MIDSINIESLSTPPDTVSTDNIHTFGFVLNDDEWHCAVGDYDIEAVFDRGELLRGVTVNGEYRCMYLPKELSTLVHDSVNNMSWSMNKTMKLKPLHQITQEDADACMILFHADNSTYPTRIIHGEGRDVHILKTVGVQAAISIFEDGISCQCSVLNRSIVPFAVIVYLASRYDLGELSKAVAGVTNA